MIGEKTIFSYSRVDSEFVLKLAKDLRNAEANVWLDQLDIEPGSHWDIAVEEAMKSSSCVMVVLTPASVASVNVMDEISYAIEEGKRLIPILLLDCDVPLRIRRFQYIDFRTDYTKGVELLIKALHLSPEEYEEKTNLNDEDSFWKKSNELFTKEAFKNYLKRFPEGKYKIEALTSIENLKKINTSKSDVKRHKQVISLFINFLKSFFSYLSNKKKIIIPAEIILLVIICLVGYYIFRPNTNPGISATAEISRMIAGLNVTETMLPNPIVQEDLIRKKHMEDSASIIAEMDKASQLFKSASLLNISNKCSEARKKYNEALISYKKVLTIDKNNRQAKNESIKINNILDNLCKEEESINFSVKRSPSDKNIILEKIKNSPNETIITLQLRKIEGTLFIHGPGSENAFFIEYDDPPRKLKLKAVKGIQTGQNIDNLSTPKSFQLIFDKLPDDVTQFNLLEGEDQIDRTVSHWNFVGIKLDR